MAKKKKDKKTKPRKTKLWDKIIKLSNGSENDKLKAIELFTNNYQKFYSKNYNPLLEKLASSKNPKKIRLKIANFLLKKPIPFSTHRTLMKVLVKDKDPDVTALTNKIILNRITRLSSTSILGMNKALENMAKITPPSILGMNKALENMTKITPPSILGMNKALENMTKITAPSIFRMNKTLENMAKITHPSILAMNKSLRNIAKLGSLTSFGLEKKELNKFTGIKNFTPPKPLLNAVALSDTVNRQLNRGIVTNFPGFYQPLELEIIEKPVKSIKKSKIQELIKKLEKCPKGKKSWKEFEDVCGEILEYCFSPPLDSPLYQEYTEKKVHRRDIIFLISHGLGDYWQYMISTYGEGIIFDCKNYTKGIPQNEIHITEKYLSRKKLTSYGVIISRKGFSENAKIAQKEAWQLRDNMIISLTDEDLIKMLELKDNRGDPWKVLDHITKKFRLGL